MKCHVDYKEWIRKALWLSLVAVVLSWSICAFLPRVLPYFDINEGEYLIEYHAWKNRSAISGDIVDSVVLINTQEISGAMARRDMADLIEALCEANPRVVGVDIRFPEREDEYNGRLRDVLLNNNGRIVVSQALYNDEIRGSFFDDEESLIFGLSNLPPYTRYAPTIGEDSLKLFSYQVAKMAYPEREWDFSRFVVNYESVEFMHFPASSVLEADLETRRSFYEGKIVLLGDFDNEKDFHHTPFNIGGKEWTIGVKLHAYPIYSLCDSERAFKKMRPFWDFFWCLVLTIILSMIFTYTALLGRVVEERQKGKLGKVYYGAYLLIRPLVIAGVVVLLLQFCFILFTSAFHIVPSAIQYIVSALIINGSMENFISHLIIRTTDE